ncbi:MAG TPA: transketolase [Baekduia sp.]|uniref:transketolase n=1 Tax=Baekduia sp. TaxID=2600305 RepID=UPI002BD0FBE7|nr:transketolase [Baekduia sp.]HMJ37386.1 transketolase [Baekduia sp.]
MEAASPSTSVDRLSVDTIRTLSMDGVQKANSGHPGLPMGMAPAAYVLYAKVMNHNPKDPGWPDRDRFILSAGHGSMLLYSVLHLSGYDLPLDELKRFRQWGSLTPGHPERDRVHVTPGVEVTTGPLGQGFANGVGMAFAEKFLRQHFGKQVMDHYIYAIVSDGDLMEGIAAEAASLAGQYGLGRLVYLYDDNSISLDGPTSLSFDSEDVTKRFEAYGWHVEEVHDANDVVALQSAIEEGKRHETKPTLVRVKSIIGYPSPHKQGTSKAHGAPLGEDEVRATKEAMGWDPDAHFLVPDTVYADFAQAAERGAAAQAQWQERFEKWRGAHEELAQQWDLAWEGGSYGGRPLPGLKDALRSMDWALPPGKEKLATRSAGQKAMAAMAPFVPTLVGGAADLSESTKTEFPGGDDERFTKEHAGRNIFFGVREHGMGGAVNGLAAHGGIVRPYGSTFLQFADYMRGAIRLGSLTGLRTAWVYTHDSVALGEDGPTHQPVEHLAALRAIPGLTVIRPADANETAEAWRVMIEDLEGPAVMALSRQDLPILDIDFDGVGRGAYVVSPELDPSQPARVTLVGTGAEVHTAIEAQKLLAQAGVASRVVSMPSWELFAEQDDSYRDDVLPPTMPRVSVEAAITMGWERWVDRAVGIDRFGASAPGAEVLEKLGITGSHVAQVAKDLLGAIGS